MDCFEGDAFGRRELGGWKLFEGLAANKKPHQGIDGVSFGKQS
jgi:hypothetical protein